MRDNSSTVASKDELDSRSQNVSWYNAKLVDIPPPIREVFEQYSKIPADQVSDHIYSVREKAWKVWPYPCIGGFRFLELILHLMPEYPTIVNRLQAGEILLDIGCCFGQEIRRLLLDGVPSENLYGLDLRSDFFELGYELFKDRQTNRTSFFIADMFQASPELDELMGKVGIVYTGAFFHLFDRPEQVQLAKRVAVLLQPKSGSMVLGRQVGHVQAGRYEHATNADGWMYRHNEESWQNLWDEVGAEVGARFEVRTELKTSGAGLKRGVGEADGVRQMHFCVTRL